eukprot:771474_1
MASVRNRCNTCDDHKYSQQEARMLKQQLDAVLQENVRSHTEHNVIDISIDDKPEIRTITNEKQDAINVELKPHIERLKVWEDDMTRLDKRFADYSELNQLKEQILGIKETPKNPDETIDLTIIVNYTHGYMCGYNQIIDEDDEKKIEISESEELYEPFDEEKHVETRARWSINPLVPTDEQKEYTLGHDGGYYELDGA